MSGVSRTGDAQYIESVITSGSVLAVTSGGEPSWKCTHGLSGSCSSGSDRRGRI